MPDRNQLIIILIVIIAIASIIVCISNGCYLLPTNDASGSSAYDLGFIAPFSLTAYPSPSQISLLWTYSNSEVLLGFIIERKIGASGTYERIATVGITERYSDTGLTSGTTYYYIVRSHKASGNGNDLPSNEAYATVP